MLSKIGSWTLHLKANFVVILNVKAKHQPKKENNERRVYEKKKKKGKNLTLKFLILLKMQKNKTFLHIPRKIKMQ